MNGCCGGQPAATGCPVGLQKREFHASASASVPSLLEQKNHTWKEVGKPNMTLQDNAHAGLETGSLDSAWNGKLPIGQNHFQHALKRSAKTGSLFFSC